ncbi:unnamed protein product, partial [Staurois parvus]
MKSLVFLLDPLLSNKKLTTLGMRALHGQFFSCAGSRGGLTIWKLGHCPWARDAPGTFFIGFFEFGQGHGSHDPLLPGGPHE